MENDGSYDRKCWKYDGNIQWLFLIPIKGGRWHIIPQLAVYTTYIPLIYCLLGGYIIPTTYYQNLKNPLKYESVLAWDPETHPKSVCIFRQSHIILVITRQHTTIPNLPPMTQEVYQAT